MHWEIWPPIQPIWVQAPASREKDPGSLLSTDQAQSLGIVECGSQLLPKHLTAKIPCTATEAWQVEKHPEEIRQGSQIHKDLSHWEEPKYNRQEGV